MFLYCSARAAGREPEPLRSMLASSASSLQPPAPASLTSTSSLLSSSISASSSTPECAWHGACKVRVGVKQPLDSLMPQPLQTCSGCDSAHLHAVCDSGVWIMSTDPLLTVPVALCPSCQVLRQSKTTPAMCIYLYYCVLYLIGKPDSASERNSINSAAITD